MPKLSDVEVPLDQLYFDLACDAFPRGVPILLQLTEPFHIMYGTDYPAIPEMVLKGHLRNAKDCPQLQGHVGDICRPAGYDSYDRPVQFFCEDMKRAGIL